VEGHIHWNMRALMRSASLDQALSREVYQEAALVPASPWLRGSVPGKPKLTLCKGAQSIAWSSGGSGTPWLWLVQTRRAGHWDTRVLPAKTTSHAWGSGSPEVVAVSAVDRRGVLSSAAILNLAGRGR
jgi:hypothetical protein